MDTYPPGGGLGNTITAPSLLDMMCGYDYINVPGGVTVLSEKLDQGGDIREAVKNLDRMLVSLAERIELLEKGSPNK